MVDHMALSPLRRSSSTWRCCRAATASSGILNAEDAQMTQQHGGADHCPLRRQRHGQRSDEGWSNDARCVVGTGLERQRAWQLCEKDQETARHAEHGTAEHGSGTAGTVQDGPHRGTGHSTRTHPWPNGWPRPAPWLSPCCSPATASPPCDDAPHTDAPNRSCCRQVAPPTFLLHHMRHPDAGQQPPSPPILTAGTRIAGPNKRRRDESGAANGTTVRPVPTSPIRSVAA